MDDGGPTSLELVILIAIFISVTAILMGLLDFGYTSGWERIFPKGLEAESTYVSGYTLHLSETYTGFSLNAGPPALLPL